jgi:peptidoglycan/xylan/chitin deacetylase (PgdA/CDA1 family)
MSLLVTTSWDDGDVLDEKLAALLRSYGVNGTFYVAQSYRQERLSDDSIRAMAQRYEIGAHTLTHPDLPKLSAEEKMREIAGSKEWLERLLNKEVSMFCYPSGHFDPGVESAVRQAGFRAARTTLQGKISTSDNAFEMPTTIQVYPMPFRKKNKTQYVWRDLFGPLRERAPIFHELGISLAALRSWEALARAAFDISLAQGSMFHLWGHSWEIERYGMWDELERVLAYMAHRSDCRYVANGELI